MKPFKWTKKALHEEFMFQAMRADSTLLQADNLAEALSLFLTPLQVDNREQVRPLYHERMGRGRLALESYLESRAQYFDEKPMPFIPPAHSDGGDGS